MKISIRDYRSIAHDTLEIPPGVTAIVGSSDTGKSGWIRAISDLIYGARGTTAVSRWAKSMLVEIDLDGCVVRLEKGNRQNRYVVGESVFAGHGTVVPDAVKMALGMQAVEVDHDRIIRPNVAQQHDPHFMLAEPPTVVAKILGAISGLDVVYSALRRAEADRAALERATLAAKVEAATASEVAVQRTVAVNDIEQLFARVEIVATQYDATQTRLTRLEHSKNSLLTAQAAVASVQLQMTRIPNKIDTTVKSIGYMWSQVDDLVKNRKRVFVARHAAITASNTLVRAVDVTAVTAIGILVQQINRLAAVRRLLSDATKGWKAQIHLEEQSRLRLGEVNHELAGITSCPLCGQVMS